MPAGHLTQEHIKKNKKTNMARSKAFRMEGRVVERRRERGVTLAMISSLVGTADTSGRAFLAPLAKSLPRDLGFLVKSTSGVALHITCYLSAENLTSLLIQGVS